MEQKYFDLTEFPKIAHNDLTFNKFSIYTNKKDVGKLSHWFIILHENECDCQLQNEADLYCFITEYERDKFYNKLYNDFILSSSNRDNITHLKYNAHIPYMIKL